MALYQMRTDGYGTKGQHDTWAELVLGIEALLLSAERLLDPWSPK